LYNWTLEKNVILSFNKTIQPTKTFNLKKRFNNPKLINDPLNTMIAYISVLKDEKINFYE